MLPGIPKLATECVCRNRLEGDDQTIQRFFVISCQMRDAGMQQPKIKVADDTGFEDKDRGGRYRLYRAFPERDVDPLVSGNINLIETGQSRCTTAL